ncbi:apoptosis-enhancing nuclease [Rhineura floridana]|uniref:apoptosis-enhancing nuclease n=1 Tax=Rhineura floridana TaxID=261503 RepID=UPI002AC8257B|nr:apoptosis-enhancing nuclease [Rhineura floridana]XP_061450965.1 apoptosis-enhancing nuclease [Rhineura floridana]
MPSNTNCAPGATSPVQVDQAHRLGMDGQVHRAPFTRWDAETCRQKKKKSRKYQRFMTQRALEQRDHLGPTSKGKTLLMTLNTCKGDEMQGSSPCEASQGGRLLKEDVVELPKELCMLCPAVSVPSMGPSRQPSPSQSMKYQVLTPSGSAEGMGSLSCLMLKKPRKCVAIDCEMVGTGPAGKRSELARCTVVNCDGDVIYDKYVQPELPIVDYRTRWSGITWRHMENATPFRVAQNEILQILRDKIVVGHAIHNDFRALKYFHPQVWTRDTSRSPLLRKKVGLPMKASVSLKSLASQLLHKNIQVGQNGHSSVEDAQTSMELYRLVEVQWEKELASSLPSSLPNSPPDSGSDSVCYMDDQYWPKDLNIDCK